MSARQMCLRALLLNAHDQPVAVAEQRDRGRYERVLARVRVDALATGAVVRDDLVRDSRAATSAGQPDGATSG
jgi:endonuclease YncB( thermonuclease family)